MRLKPIGELTDLRLLVSPPSKLLKLSIFIYNLRRKVLKYIGSVWINSMLYKLEDFIHKKAIALPKSWLPAVTEFKRSIKENV